MSSSGVLEGNAIDQRISSLKARLKAENDVASKEAGNNINLALPNTPRMRPKLFADGGSPLPLRSEGTPTRSRKELELPILQSQNRGHQDNSEVDNKMKEIMKLNGILTIHNFKYTTKLDDLEHLGELGNGTCGHVVKMRHKPSNAIIAVKQMRRSGNVDENKRIIMDIDVVLKSHDCPYIVQCLGCFITTADVWICMELMATCFDKLLKKLRKPIPEPILGKVTVATVKALHYLKETHGVIHRDVKPSNILLDEKGNVKLCDFGISGRLVDSKANTRSAGCAAYMAPERIDPPDPTKPDYDIRADVWSLGITLVELATGHFPYQECTTDFEVLTKVLQDDPPSLPRDSTFGREFVDFVSSCLTKNVRQRPKYRKLLEHPFIQKYERAEVDVASWFARATKQTEVTSTATQTLNTPLLQFNSPLRRITASPVTVNQPSPTPPRRQGTFNHAHLHQVTNHHHRHSSVPEPLPITATHRHDIRFPRLQHETVPPIPPQRIFPAEQRKRHPSEPHQNGTSSYKDRWIGTKSPPPRSTSPLVQQHTEIIEQKRYASYANLQLRNSPVPTNYTNSSQIQTNTRYYVDGVVSPPSAFYYNSRFDPITIPPSPPARGSRDSPRHLHRGCIDPTRRSLGNNESATISPSLSRRYISPTPPQPPPRRLSESSSVPGSPQHFQMRLRYHYTPEPQRRFYQTNHHQDPV